jgi:hypothetical protein
MCAIVAVEIGAATPNRREDAEPDEIVREVTRCDLHIIQLNSVEAHRWLFFDVPRPVPVLGRWICLEAFDALEQSR